MDNAKLEQAWNEIDRETVEAWAKMICTDGFEIDRETVKAPQPNDRLLEAAKAVLDWYTSEPKSEWNPHMEALLISIQAIEAQGGSEK